MHLPTPLEKILEYTAVLMLGKRVRKNYYAINLYIYIYIYIYVELTRYYGSRIGEKKYRSNNILHLSRGRSYNRYAAYMTQYCNLVHSCNLLNHTLLCITFITYDNPKLLHLVQFNEGTRCVMCILNRFLFIIISKSEFVWLLHLLLYEVI